jgi:protein ImuA
MSCPEDRSTTQLAALLRHPELWQAGHLSSSPQAVASGFAALDRHLPGGGWPASGLAELLLATAGVGELRLLAPLLGTLSRRQARWVAWVAPPFMPYAPALAAHGVDVGRLLLIHPNDHRQALWALERAARSGSCSLILAWLDERRLRQADTRRLKLAARRGNTLICLFRPEQAAARPSLAELRLRLRPAEAGAVTVDVCKRRGGWPVSGIRLQLDDRPGADAVRAQLALWRRWQQRSAGRPGIAAGGGPPHGDAAGDGTAHRPGNIAAPAVLVH